jgi:predicted metal-dependent phosphoesterase TrpH
VIDLHLHTTASDGQLSPEQLVRTAAAAGITTLAVTDHDTTAGVAAAREAAGAVGVEVVMGIEITAVLDGRDVHILGYFFDDTNPELVTFLAAQREDRRRRVDAIVERLNALGAPVDHRELTRQAEDSRKAIGRPAIAQAIVAAGHARDVQDAFDRFLADGRPAFISREGAPPAEVIALLRRSGGVASFAHPGKLGLDHVMPRLAAAGLAGLEVFHPDHDAVAVEKYARMADALNLTPTGGSDYHAPGSARAACLGVVGLDAAAYAALVARAQLLGGPGTA